MISTVSAVNIGAPSGGSRNPAKPTPLDFRCDVDKAVKTIVPEGKLRRFYLAYTTPASEDEIEQGVFEQSILGGVRHRLGAAFGRSCFIKRGLYPVQGRGYFYSVRQGNCDNKA